MVVPIVQYGCICMTGLKYYTENKQCMKKHSKKNKYMFSRLCSHSWSKIIYVFRNITTYCRWGKGRVVKLNNAWSYLFWWTRCTVSTLVEKCKYSPCPHETLVFTPSLPSPSPWIRHYKQPLLPESPFSKHNGFASPCSKASNCKSAKPMPVSAAGPAYSPA